MPILALQHVITDEADNKKESKAERERESSSNESYGSLLNNIYVMNRDINRVFSPHNIHLLRLLLMLSTPPLMSHISILSCSLFEYLRILTASKIVVYTGVFCQCRLSCTKIYNNLLKVGYGRNNLKSLPNNDF